MKSKLEINKIIDNQNHNIEKMMLMDKIQSAHVTWLSPKVKTSE